jgi:hypothetical protein
MRVHDAAHAAIDSTGGSVSHAIRTAGLRDAVLGSRTTAVPNVPPGTPVGSASVYQSGDIPSAVQNAVNNLGNNVQNNSLATILQQILHGVGSTYTPSPQQNALYSAQTAQINQQMKTQAAPAEIQAKIDAQNAANPVRYGYSPPALPGQYNPASDTALQNLYGQQAQAKQAARGWTPPNY